ncbi:ABC transporter ATP-binding protein [Lactiplantibacillus plantarum]|jgi:putative ABC transport system ATP-binding protein|uniref:Putative hemin import ATP-binding protein HrtA n=1 Tax=Lactiplantibacillus plantarum CMPG5300 TaxID=1304889 RepID=A0AAW3FLR3_LACPN|nr:ABC transporter ATP-binding protein [Lactiplantibacillus plantarum]MCS6094010.1 ABC transporter ATP-binding protein [Lactobacillus sp. LMY-20]UZM82234.1 ABC transporter ATP-binding protein [Lactiplantibacillus argentoratensis]AGL65057.2 ABC transporter, ATP-binding protein [Lactiplantibacillus plantarum subsp. plantarum P-8]AGO08898.1 ABC transporter ATP-binding protein [Lactiplantibacillus plantarum 16]AOG33404.1 ABC transporter, ATP-binding protein [Lactiplantibacillus plantarum]
MSQPVLALQNINKQFGHGHTAVNALTDANFEVSAGQFVAIIGPSGSGKSTFLTIAAGLQTPTSGQVILNGQPLSNQTEKQRLAYRFNEIGFILQSSNLIPFLTVREQFKLVDKMARRKFDQAGTDGLLAELALTEVRDAYPSDLSGGERQRVAIARALYNDPSVILADEPTASLDTPRSIDVVKRLANEAHQHQKAIVMVTHDQRLIDDCDVVYQIEDGKMSRRDS